MLAALVRVRPADERLAAVGNGAFGFFELAVQCQRVLGGAVSDRSAARVRAVFLQSEQYPMVHVAPEPGRAPVGTDMGLGAPGVRVREYELRDHAVRLFVHCPEVRPVQPARQGVLSGVHRDDPLTPAGGAGVPNLGGGHDMARSPRRAAPVGRHRTVAAESGPQVFERVAQPRRTAVTARR